MMNVKTEIVALAVRYLSENTNLINRPDGLTEFFAVLSTGKTHDVRTAESIIVTSEKAADAARKLRDRRKFNNIVTHSYV